MDDPMIPQVMAGFKGQFDGIWRQWKGQGNPEDAVSRSRIRAFESTRRAGKHFFPKRLWSYRARQRGGELVLSYDKSGLLVELQVSNPDRGGTIRYEYGPVTVLALADAIPAPAPIPFLGPSRPIPDLP